ncbi:hypothetical protein SLEP1_g41047 [Rubroshorea leprosula]|uniref:Endonuclease/exonuclease/phosphatase domain-containing protein n=1 Tax=Rubroshorea leprosula TaxID=152421 RepID=A0AAV5L5D1_9ROSI|nr:hypothetical protein SLEP1_g41047 [Rubroshorea leprosula]
MMGKRALWEELKHLIQENRGNWYMVGDFNAILGTHESKGGGGSVREMREFNEFMEGSGLLDLLLIGRKFTWYHPNGSSMSRLDRILVSKEWLSNWKECKQWGLKRIILDHSPILLKNQIRDWGPQPFRVFDARLEQPGFKQMVEEMLNSIRISAWRSFQLRKDENLEQGNETMEQRLCPWSGRPN